MVSQVTSSTFLSTYNDDYTDSDHYHRILFNSGRALQARELTQMQTIIQKEIARMAGFLFKEGAIFSTSAGAVFADTNAVRYVKLDDALPTGYATLVGTTVEDGDGVQAIVKAAIPATGSDPATLLVSYTTSGGIAGTTSGPRIFQSGGSLSYDTGTISGTLTVQTTNTAANPATGKGAFVEVPRFDTFAAGHLIMVEKQSLVVSKYDHQPTVTVGFVVSEDIVTASDDIALYDNSGSTPNLTSPGADRYRITLTLTTADDIDSDQTFYPLYDIRNGVVRNLQDQDKVLAQMGSILNARTSDISGNFISRDNPRGAFNLDIRADSDAAYLQYVVEGGVAFINGQRTDVDKSTKLRVAKSRTAATDTRTVTNEFTTARYGSFFLADSCYGIIQNITSLDKVFLYTAADRLGSNIGTARVRSVDEYDNQYRIHIFDLNLTSGSIASIRSIGNDAADYANLVAVDGGYDIYDRAETSLIFPLPDERVNTISAVSTNIGKIYTTTSNGSGEATFSTGGNNFADAENWIVAVDSSGELFSPPTISSGGAGSTSAVISGLPTSSAVSMYAFESKNLVRKTKTLVTGRLNAGLSLSSRKFTLDRSDVYRITSIIDDTTSEDVTYRYTLDNGQRDDFYTVATGRLRNGFSAPASTVSVTFDYFSHSAGDYFAGTASYPDLDLTDIPLHTTSQNVTYRLSDVIDMRPIKNNAGSGFTGTGAVIEDIPKNGTTITVGSVSYWLPRVDAITVDDMGLIRVKQGKPEINATLPVDIPSTEMVLHGVRLNGYTINEKDTLAIAVDNRGYKMQNIRKLENRISNLEAYATLTASELANIRTTIPDPNDATLPDRVKLGLTADGFTNNRNSAQYDADYRATINTVNGQLQPMGFFKNIQLHYDSAQSSYTVLKGSTIWPKYTEEVMIKQDVASSAIDVNQFQITRSVGNARLTPDTDTWQIRKKVDESYKVESKDSFKTFGSKIVGSQGDKYTIGGKEYGGSYKDLSEYVKWLNQGQEN